MSDEPSFSGTHTHEAAPAPAVPRAAYVEAALALHCPALPADAAARVHEQFARIASLAAPVLAFPLAADEEPAPVFRL